MEKKSLISTLKTTKKANVAAAPASNEGASTRKSVKKGTVNRRADFRKASMGKMSR